MNPARVPGKGPLLVGEVMSAPVLTVRSAATAHEAREVMRLRRIQHLVVVGADGGVEGVLSERDLRSAQPSTMLIPDRDMREKALSLVRVGEIMSRHPHTVTPNMPVAALLEKMLEAKVGSIPVVDHKGRPVGIVTGFDVILLALGLLEEAGR